jgi:hypothetical protein
VLCVGLLSQDDRVSAGAQGGARFSAAGLPSMVDRSRAADDDWITDAPPPSAMAAALLATAVRPLPKLSLHRTAVDKSGAKLD